MVFQSYALFPHLSVAENIVFGLKVATAPPIASGATDARRRLVGLAEQLDRKPQQLSGGQRQRVALARAIVARNPICLMDEPLSNLDAQLRQTCACEIRALQQRLGMTVVYVTHDQVEAMSMADHVVLLREGRIEQEARPPNSTPAGDHVRRAVHRHAPDEYVSARESINPGQAAGLTVGIRPEDIRIRRQGISRHGHERRIPWRRHHRHRAGERLLASCAGARPGGFRYRLASKAWLGAGGGAYFRFRREEIMKLLIVFAGLLASTA